MDHGAPPPPPPPPQLELSLSTVVAPQKRRRSARTTRRTLWPATPVVPPPAVFPPVPSAPHQIPAPPVAAAPPDAGNLLLLAHIAVSQADAEAEASSPPAPAGKKLRSAPALPPAAADEDKPYAPPLPPVAVDEKSSSMSTDYGHAATKASAEDYKKAACPPGDDAGSSKGDHSGGGVAASPAAAASPQPQPWDDDDEELEPGEIPPEKPATGCNADSAHEFLLGKEEEEEEEEETAAGEEAKTTIAREPASMGSSAHRAPAVVVSTGVLRRDGKAAATEMSAAEEKTMREVFVGGLSRDATEEDVRAALSAAGRITKVRMIWDRTTEKNKGYCFVEYRDAAMARKAVAEFGNVKICGKRCRVAVPDGNEKANKTAQRDPTIEDYNRMYEQGQPSPTLAVHSSAYIRSWDHYAIPASSYVVPPVGAIPASHYIPMYHTGNGVYLPADLNHGQVEPWGSQMGQSGSSRPPTGKPPHRRRN